MNKLEFYLDTSVYGRDGLADPKSQYTEAAKALEKLVDEGNCRVYGSTELLEELAGIRRTDCELLDDVLKVFWKLVGKHVLVDYSATLIRELKKGAHLSVDEAYLDAETIARLRHCPPDDCIWGEIHDAVRKRERAYANGDSRLGCEFTQLALEDLKEHGEKAPRILRKEIAAMKVDQATVEEWFDRFLESEQEKLPISKDRKSWPRIAGLPSIRGQFSFLIAQQKTRHSSGKKPERGDRYDLVHYVHAAYPGCLVTSDRGFRNTCKIIEWKPVRVLSLEEFAACVASLTSGQPVLSDR